jgi:rubrerythrin
MSLWSRLFRWGSDKPDDVADSEPEAAPAGEPDNTVELPRQPFVFECQSCGKVFEARRKRPQCPECDSPDVSILSE